MKHALLLFVALSPWAYACVGSGTASSAKRPNVVVFLVDDMGWQDTSVPFHSEVTEQNRRFRTPNMERLAAGGVKFTQAYASAICSPTRISFITGLNAARHRVTNWTLRKNTSTDRTHARLDLPPWNVNGLAPEAGIERTVHARALPENLRRAGYRTIHVGKAHFGAIDTPGSDPRNLGFDVNIGGHAAGAPASYYGKHNFSSALRHKNPAADTVWDVPGLEEAHGQDIFLTEALSLRANRAVRRAVADERPFFLYFATYAVHTPIMANPRYVENYADLDPTEAAYATLIEGMDAALGSVLDTLEELGVADNTLILFMSDNGGLSHAGRGGRRYRHNAPLSSGKGSAHEGGIRVPMLARWPGVTQPGSMCASPVIIEDFFATIHEVTGVPLESAVDGRSFVPLLRGRTAPARDLIWHQPNNWVGDRGPGLGPHSSLRSGDWKLIYYHEPSRAERFELFDLAHDIGEEHNLAQREPERLAQLRTRLADALRECDAQMPVDRERDAPVRWPDADL